MADSLVIGDSLATAEADGDALVRPDVEADGSSLAVVEALTAGDALVRPDADAAGDSLVIGDSLAMALGDASADGEASADGQADSLGAALGADSDGIEIDGDAAPAHPASAVRHSTATAARSFIRWTPVIWWGPGT